jgi:hypothetical protein
VVVASSMLGQPAVRVIDSDDDQAATAHTTVAIANHAAVSVAVATGARAALIWLAEPALEPIDVRLRLAPVSAPKHTRAGYGQVSGILDSSQAHAFDLVPGPKRVQLTLTPGVVAALASGEVVHSVHFGADDSLVETLDSTASNLLLVHTGSRSASYSVEILPVEEAKSPLAAGSPFEGWMATAGTLRLAVAAAEAGPRTLHVLGARDEAMFIDSQGQVRRGTHLTLGPSAGTLLVPHQPGLLMAWFGPAHDPEAGLWTGVEPPPAEAITLPARLELDGSTRTLAMSTAAPVLLTVGLDSPTEACLSSSAGERCWIEARAGVRHLYLPSGDATLTLCSAAGSQLGHTVELTATAVTEVGEGLGSEVLLAPGSGHAFRFSVTEATAVGVGVRASSDTVQCRLMTADGEAFGDGIVQMHDLDRGAYLLVLRNPPEGQAVLVRPAVVGIAKPSTGPPEETIRRHLEMERRSQ